MKTSKYGVLALLIAIGLVVLVTIAIWFSDDTEDAESLVMFGLTLVGVCFVALAFAISLGNKDNDEKDDK
jgi:hypothetical protein